MSGWKCPALQTLSRCRNVTAVDRKCVAAMYLHLSKGRKNEAFQCRAAHSEPQEVGGGHVRKKRKPLCYRHCDKIPGVPAYHGISN